jgi:hypothetical protein
LTIYECYKWKITSNFGLGTSFRNMYEWERIREETKEANNSTKAYITNDETSQQALRLFALN